MASGRSVAVGKNEISLGAEEMGTIDNAARSFERLKVQLKARLGAEVFSSWFQGMKLTEAGKGVVRISVPTAFLRSWINGHYLDLMNEIWRNDDPSLIKLEVVVRSAARHAPHPQGEEDRKPIRPAAQAGQPAALVNLAERRPLPKPAQPTDAARTQVLGSPLDSRHTFASFIEGPSNRVAYAAARTVAEAGAGPVRFNPLFIHASVGLGKTHLLQAIAAESLARNPRARVVYLTAEYFMFRFASAIRDNYALVLKEQFRDIDLLIIDDMQFLQGKSIQHEFCHLLNMLLDSAKQVVVAADRPPAELESLEPRVRSRLLGGVALEVYSPEFEIRLAMLEQRMQTAKAEHPALDISGDVLEHVARIVTGNGRDLEGAFNQLLLRHELEPQITVDRIDDILGRIYRSGEPKRVRIEDIQRVVAKHYNVSKTELLSNRRTQTVVKPRQVAMYLSKAMTPRSLPEIGRRFGGRDHTTVLHAVRKIEGLSSHDNTLAQELELLRRLIMEQP